MNWTLPGTTITVRRNEADSVKSVFESLFLAGGLTLSQVSSITGLESYAIQNWVKRGFLSAPVGKKYTMEQLCRIITIHMLRGPLTLEQITGLMSYVNGDLADDSDDLIDDAELYFMFVRLAARARHIGGSQQWDEAVESVLTDYTEPVPGARERVGKVLRTMLTAWVANRLRLETEEMLKKLMQSQ